MSFHNQNRAAWNRLAESGSLFAKVASDEELRNPLQTIDGRGWLPASIAGLDVLCLASGGGWQSVLFAAAGARVTVVDLSPTMLAIDRRETARRGLTAKLIEASMEDLSPLADASFDIVHQPVSTCYVEDLAQVYREVARVTRDDGLYISQHKAPTSMQVVDRDARNRYLVGVSYYHKGPLPPVTDESYRETGAVEFLHRWEHLVGDLCRSGFVIEDLREPYRGDPQAAPGDFHHRGWYIAPFMRMKARRVPRAASTTRKKLWVPSE